MCIGVDNPLIIILFSTEITFSLHHSALKRVRVVIPTHLSLSFVSSHIPVTKHIPHRLTSHTPQRRNNFPKLCKLSRFCKSHTEKIGDRCVWAHLHVPLLSQLNIRSLFLYPKPKCGKRHCSTAAPRAEAERRVQPESLRIAIKPHEQNGT